ncbi:hypothetical protein AB4144_67335, partial [Rhizobiaceae sp. 2RAB30]
MRLEVEKLGKENVRCQPYQAMFLQHATGEIAKIPSQNAGRFRLHCSGNDMPVIRVRQNYYVDMLVEANDT